METGVDLPLAKPTPSCQFNDPSRMLRHENAHHSIDELLESPYRADPIKIVLICLCAYSTIEVA